MTVGDVNDGALSASSRLAANGRSTMCEGHVQSVCNSQPSILLPTTRAPQGLRSPRFLIGSFSSPSHGNRGWPCGGWRTEHYMVESMRADRPAQEL